MNTKLIATIGLAALLAGAGAASATTSYSQSRTSIWPNSVDLTGVEFLGLSFCELVLDSTQLGCSHGGLGAIFDISSLNDTSNGYATGSCKATVPTLQSGTVSCGTDRDDDTFITNSDAHPQSGDVAGGDFDDDFVDGVTGVSIPINCFERDLDNSDAVNAANNDWDDVAVFVAATVPDLHAQPGFATIDLTLNTQASSCGVPDGH
jgi:hypothetical protein